MALIVILSTFKIENCDDSSEKSKSVITALCEAKADCQAKNRKRRTPYELAVRLPLICRLHCVFAIPEAEQQAYLRENV